MSRLRQGLKRRSAGVVNHPRHFLQLLLPTMLILCGWLALAVEWWRVGVVLISAALLVFAALIWLRLRRLQGRLDKGFRLAALRSDDLAPTVAASDSSDEPTESHGTVDIQDEEEPVAPELTSVPPASAVVAGMHAGLFRALECAAPTAREAAVLVVPSAQRSVVTNWVEGTAPGRWKVIDEQSGLLRSQAVGVDVVIIVDPGDRPTYPGVLDQNFFWWLPRSSRMLLVSHDVVGFASRLAKEHDVELALTQHESGSSQASVTRMKG